MKETPEPVAICPDMFLARSCAVSAAAIETALEALVADAEQAALTMLPGANAAWVRVREWRIIDRANFLIIIVHARVELDGE